MEAFTLNEKRIFDSLSLLLIFIETHKLYIFAFSKSFAV